MPRPRVQDVVQDAAPAPPPPTADDAALYSSDVPAPVAPPPPPPLPPAAAAVGAAPSGPPPRFARGAEVLVKRSNGTMSAAIVESYDADTLPGGGYWVALRDGSSKLAPTADVAARPPALLAKPAKPAAARPAAARAAPSDMDWI